jgi:hypothetical protein
LAGANGVVEPADGVVAVETVAMAAFSVQMLSVVVRSFSGGE